MDNLRSKSHNYCLTLLKNRINLDDFERKPLSQSEAEILSKCSKEDAVNYIYNSAISLSSAMNGIRSKNYSWSIVQLYYSVFYATRSILSYKNNCFVYVKKTETSEKLIPFHIEAKIGFIPKKQKEPSTHKLCIKFFELIFPGSVFLTQEINNMNPFKWIMREREKANYNVCRMPEPNPPPCLNFIYKQEMRRLISQYVCDTSYMWTFDDDHSILAFPLTFFRDTVNDLKASGASLDGNIDGVNLYFRDNVGPLDFMINLFKD